MTRPGDVIEVWDPEVEFDDGSDELRLTAITPPLKPAL